MVKRHTRKITGAGAVHSLVERNRYIEARLLPFCVINVHPMIIAIVDIVAQNAVNSLVDKIFETLLGLLDAIPLPIP